MKQDSGKRLPRFMLEHADTQEQFLDLPEELMHYASRVLRLREGEQLRIWNGKGTERLATVHYLSKNKAQVKPLEFLPVHSTELTRPLHVLQALPEGDKMDWVLEKCTELGVTRFHPVQAQRSVVKLNDERANKRQAHWKRVVLAASLQSERQVLPILENVDGLQGSLKAILDQWPQATALWFTPHAGARLSDWVDQHRADPARQQEPLVICVGPEGGWSPDETELAVSMGAVPLSFSKRVLRTETFAIACAAQLTALLKLEAN